MSKIDTLNPEFKEQIIKLKESLEQVTGLDWCIVQARRTIAEQNALYAKGRTAPGEKVTNAKGGQSPHNFGEAVDLCPMKDGNAWWNAPDKYWQSLGGLAEGMGLVWGGNFKSIIDKPHVESKDWKNLQAKWKAGEVQIA